MNYKRLYIENSNVHIIIVSYNRQKIFTNNIELLKEAFIHSKKFFKFDIIAICVLPDHIHMIINPNNIKEYPKIITSIKYYFSKNYNVGVETPTYGYAKKGEKGIFQRRYFKHTILNIEELNRQIDYIHYNPVKHGYVKCVKDWKYSSFNNFVKREIYELDWGTIDETEEIRNLNIE